MKKFIKITATILIVLVVLAFSKDMIIKTAVEKGVEVVTGLPLQMKGLTVGIIKTLVGIRDLKVLNPAGFKDRVMIDMPEIYVDYNLPDIIKGKIHLNDVRLNLKEFVVVKKKELKESLDKSDPRLVLIDQADAWRGFLSAQQGQDKLAYNLAIEFHPLEPGLQNIYRYLTLRLPGLRDSKGDRPVVEFKEEIVNIAKPTRQRLEGYWQPPETGQPSCSGGSHLQ